MDRMRRFAGMGKPKVPSAVQKDKDESIVFFRELYKREKDKDVNLLEPMYSVEFDAIQGDRASRVPSGKRDFLIPVDEKHDYDWLKTAPATPLFPSLEIEANSSQLVIQKELPIPPRQVKPSASRPSGKPEATKTSARPVSSTASSSSKRTFTKDVPAASSNEKKLTYTADQRSSHKVPVNGHRKPAAGAAPGTRIGGAPKKHSERCYASQTSGTSTVKGVTDQETPFKAPKNLITTTRSIFRRRTPLPENNAGSKDPGPGADVRKENGKATRSIFRRRTSSPENDAGSKDPGSGADVRKENGKVRKHSCAPQPPIRGMTELQLQDRRDALPPRWKSVTGSGGGEPVAGTGGRAGRAETMRGAGRADGRAWI